jgi:hypothetical protein
VAAAGATAPSAPANERAISARAARLELRFCDFVMCLILFPAGFLPDDRVDKTVIDQVATPVPAPLVALWSK